MAEVKPWILFLTIFFVALDFARRYIPLLAKVYISLFIFVTRPLELKQVSGASWVFSGSALTILLFPEDIVIVSLLVLSLADSAAALIGLKFGQTQFYNKSLEGSIAFFITTIILIITLTPYSIWIQISAAIVSTISELFANNRFNDNVLIPLTTASMLTLGALV